jgi:hypothetical protein
LELVCHLRFDHCNFHQQVGGQISRFIQQITNIFLFLISDSLTKLCKSFLQSAVMECCVTVFDSDT